MNAFTTGNPTSRATAALPSDGPKINHNREETVVRLVTLPVWCPGGHTDDVGLAAVAHSLTSSHPTCVVVMLMM